MPLVKNGHIATDIFFHAADGAELPGDGPVLVSGARFLEDPEGLLKRGKVGVIWPNNRDLDDLVPYLDRLALVALVFPSFRDGRAYTQARLLRERHGYEGELRATGQVLPDQLLLMRRCGFDAFELAKNAPLETWKRALESFSVVYQPAADGREPITLLRRVLGSRA